jgi:hypothetical protein
MHNRKTNVDKILETLKQFSKNMFNKQRNNSASRSHFITITSSAENRPCNISLCTRFGDHYLFHQCFLNPHGLDRINRLFSAELNYTFYSNIAKQNQVHSEPLKCLTASIEKNSHYGTCFNAAARNT